ncbi:MAG: hypothetical protein ACPG4X_22635, partial [Pikeienuella sp.]
SKIDELKQEVEHLSGQLVGAQAALDTLMGALIQSGAIDTNSLRFTLQSTAEVFPMNPNMRNQEVAGATAFLNSMISTIDLIEGHMGKRGK